MAGLLCAYLLILGISASYRLCEEYPKVADGPPLQPGMPAEAGLDSNPQSPEGAEKAAENGRGLENTTNRMSRSPVGDREGSLLLIAIYSGLMGSFIACSLSLAAYVGNRRFRVRWVMWYVLRPWIGAALSGGVYLLISAGLVSSAGHSNASGIAATALLTGWFSKEATEKVREMFRTFLGVQGQHGETSERDFEDKLTETETRLSQAKS
ncbi:MAG UNVERIFIED_CONTAM: hypothetical protein LVR18_17525 [Planctomycetaceae bacterium]